MGRKRHAERKGKSHAAPKQGQSTLTHDPGDGSKHYTTLAEASPSLGKPLNTRTEHARALRAGVRQAIAELPRAAVQFERLPGELAGVGLVLTVSYRAAEDQLVGALRRTDVNGVLEQTVHLSMVEAPDAFANRLAEILPMFCRVLAGQGFRAHLDQMLRDS